MPEVPPILIPRPLDRLSGDEPIGETGALIRAFWSWAYSDLRSNTERGIFAEFLVAQAVGDTSPLRKAWANHDVTTPSGVRVEVKAFGYLQSWHQRRLSTPSFGRLTGRTWDEETGEFGIEPEVRADVFVFALQTCRDPDVYDVLDLDQWEFRVVPAAAVRDSSVRTVGMSFLNQHASRPVGWSDLADAIDAAAQ